MYCSISYANKHTVHILYSVSLVSSKYLGSVPPKIYSGESGWEVYPPCFIQVRQVNLNPLLPPPPNEISVCLTSKYFSMLLIDQLPIQVI
jgi:hypothetical protein